MVKFLGSWESWFICLFLDQQLVCKWQIPLILFCKHLSVKLGLLWKELFLLDRQKPNWLVDLRGGRRKGREGEWEGGEGGCGSPYICPGNFLSFLWLHQHLSEPWPSRFTPRARFSPASLHCQMRVSLSWPIYRLRGSGWVRTAFLPAESHISSAETHPSVWLRGAIWLHTAWRVHPVNLRLHKCSARREKCLAWINSVSLHRGPRKDSSVGVERWGWGVGI